MGENCGVAKQVKREDRQVAGRTERRGIRVAIECRIRLLREGVERALSVDPEINLVEAEVSSDGGDGAPRAVDLDVLLIDGSVVAARCLEAEGVGGTRSVRLVAYGLADDDDEGIAACAAIGVTSFVASSGSSEDLAAAIKSAVRGDVYLSAGLRATSLRRLASGTSRKDCESSEICLTQREAEIVECLESGLSNKKIAAQLGIELATVKNHVHNILAKHAVHRRSDLVALVRETRLRATQASARREI